MRDGGEPGPDPAAAAGPSEQLPAPEAEFGERAFGSPAPSAPPAPPPMDQQQHFQPQQQQQYMPVQPANQMMMQPYPMQQPYQQQPVNGVAVGQMSPYPPQFDMQSYAQPQPAPINPQPYVGQQPMIVQAQPSHYQSNQNSECEQITSVVICISGIFCYPIWLAGFFFWSKKDSTTRVMGRISAIFGTCCCCVFGIWFIIAIAAGTSSSTSSCYVSDEYDAKGCIADSGCKYCMDNGDSTGSKLECQSASETHKCDGAQYSSMSQICRAANWGQCAKINGCKTGTLSQTGVLCQTSSSSIDDDR